MGMNCNFHNLWHSKYCNYVKSAKKKQTCLMAKVAVAHLALKKNQVPIQSPSNYAFGIFWPNLL